MSKSELKIEGMTCASCVARVERSLKKVPGVRDARVNLATERADVEYEADVGDQTLTDAVDRAGYKAIPIQVSDPFQMELNVGGMTCASCVARVERSLKKVQRVKDAQVNLSTERAVVTVEPDGPAEADLIRAVEAAGYNASPVEAETAARQDQLQGERDAALRKQRLNLIVAAVLTTPVVLLAMFWEGRPEWANWLQLVLTTPVVFGSGWSFFKVAWKNARHLSATMDTLIAIGTGAAWAFSLYGLITHRGMPMHQSMSLYFETAAAIITLILLGRYLEARARGRTSAAIEKLLGLAPKKAILVRDDGSEAEVAGDPGAYILAFSIWDMPEVLDLACDSAVYIYSSSEAYGEDSRLQLFQLWNWIGQLGMKLHGFTWEGGETGKPVFNERLNASGHIDESSLREMLLRVQPTVVVPVHTERPEWFAGCMKGTRSRVVRADSRGRVQI